MKFFVCDEYDTIMELAKQGLRSQELYQAIKKYSVNNPIMGSHLLLPKINDGLIGPTDTKLQLKDAALTRES